MIFCGAAKLVAAATGHRRKAKRKAAKRRRKAHGVCRPAGTPPQGEKRIKLDCMSLLFVCAVSRFGKPRSFLTKVLIVAVRSCGCGGLIRSLRNLGASQKGNGFILFACTKRTKSTPEVCEPLDSGDDSNRRSIRCFCENDRQSSGNRFCEKLQLRRVSPAMI